MTQREKLMAVTIGVLAVAVAVLAFLLSSARSDRDDALAAAALLTDATESMEDDAQDANARSLLRNGAIALESYYADVQGFDGAGPDALSSIEPNIEWTTASNASTADSQVRLQLGTPNGGYTLTTRSGSGRVYAYARDEMAVVTRTCTRGDATQECAGPTW